LGYWKLPKGGSTIKEIHHTSQTRNLTNPQNGGCSDLYIAVTWENSDNKGLVKENGSVKTRIVSGEHRAKKNNAAVITCWLGIVPDRGGALTGGNNDPGERTESNPSKFSNE